MNITAIICEYNPLTNGHIKHLKCAKEETNCDAIFCIMSGSFTQRGDAAILDKYIRAELAIMNGSDIVVELPTVFQHLLLIICNWCHENYCINSKHQLSKFWF